MRYTCQKPGSDADMRATLSFRRVLRCGRYRSPQCRRHDGHLNGTDNVHALHGGAFSGLEDVFQVGLRLLRSRRCDVSHALICSRRSSRSKRKLERKVGSGRKGTVDEEEYLLKSVTKLVARFNTAQGQS